MGGNGSSMWGMQSGHIFAMVATQAQDYAAEVSGWASADGIYTNRILERFGYPVVLPEDSTTVGDNFNNMAWLQNNPEKDIPFYNCRNGVLDGAMLWENNYSYFKYFMTEARQPGRMHWTQTGHSTTHVTAIEGFEIRKDRSLPAFNNCSMDSTIGTELGTEASEGFSNQFLRWNRETIIDEAERWEIGLYIDSSATDNTCTVDVTPRRLQNLMHGPGSIMMWSLEEADGTEVLPMTNTTVDENGLFTMTNLPLTKDERILKVLCSMCYPTTGTVATASGVSQKLSIEAHPNPFNPTTVITVKGAGTFPVKALRIYSLTGSLIKTIRPGASHSFVFDGSGVPSGIYIARATMGTKVLEQKLVLMK